MTNLKMSFGRVRDNSAKVNELYNNTQLYNSHTLYYGGQESSGLYPQIAEAGDVLSSNYSASEITPDTRKAGEIIPSNYSTDEIKPNNYSIQDY